MPGSGAKFPGVVKAERDPTRKQKSIVDSSSKMRSMMFGGQATNT